MKEIKKIGVVGAGQMGRGIAQVAAMSSYDVVVYDISKEGLDKGVGFIKDQLSRGVDKGKWDNSFVDKTLSHISTSTELKGLADCDLVIEAATENKKI